MFNPYDSAEAPYDDSQCGICGHAREEHVSLAEVEGDEEAFGCAACDSEQEATHEFEPVFIQEYDEGELNQDVVFETEGDLEIRAEQEWADYEPNVYDGTYSEE